MTETKKMCASRLQGTVLKFQSLQVIVLMKVVSFQDTFQSANDETRHIPPHVLWDVVTCPVEEGLIVHGSVCSEKVRHKVGRANGCLPWHLLSDEGSKGEAAAADSSGIV